MSEYVLASDRAFYVTVALILVSWVIISVYHWGKRITRAIEGLISYVERARSEMSTRDVIIISFHVALIISIIVSWYAITTGVIP